MKSRMWGSRHLSYAARTILVNNVLLSLHTYQARIFVIPKGVIKRIITLYRNFLWDGKFVTNRSPPVAQCQVCKSEVEGGLGIRDCNKWNKAAIGKLIWNIASKPDSLWMKWVNHTYLKGQSFQSHSPLPDATWAWKRIWKVGQLFTPAYNDYTWTKANTDVYSMKTGYQWLAESNEKVTWNAWVWNNFNVPKHSMICWMMCLDKLKTKERLKSMGICQDDTCAVCGVGSESRNHIFFECQYSQRCSQLLCDADVQKSRKDNAMSAAEWIRRRFKGSRFSRKTLYALLAATVYNTWMNINTVCQENKCESPKLNVKHIIEEVRSRILCMLKVKISDKNWLLALGLS